MNTVTDQLSADERDGAADPTAPTSRRGADPDRDAGGANPADGSESDAQRSTRRGRRRDRISRWDRPPEPRDWRFFVGNVGRILIATGLLMFGFVAYQLWGTGIETARAQNRLENEFEQLVADYQAARNDSVPTPDPSGGTAPDPSTSSPAEPIDADSPTTEPTSDTTPELVVGEIVSGDVETIVPVDLSDAAIDQDIPPFGRGDPLALLEIPAIGRSDIVVPGVSLDDLKSGPGHYPDTPLPGQLGNAAIAGHRTTYGAPFFDVDQLERGDEIIVTMVTGDRFVYEVSSLEVVSATDYWVVTTSDPNIAALTLTSCHPKYTARDRIVVHSLLNPAKSSTVGVPTFYDLDDGDDGDDGDEAIPGDDPVVAEQADRPDIAPDTTVAATPDDDADPIVDPDSTGGSTSTPAASDDSSTLSETPPGDVEDAFGQGWFEDAAAWPQIALWAVALTLISMFASRVSRRFRRYTIGFVVGVAPFLVALYFFYQNVNRLLPPGI